MLKIVFFGVGSIAKKHINLINDRKFEIFSFKSNFKSKKITNINTFKALEEIKPNIGFITNPTGCHIKTLLKIHQLKMHLFIEKPLTNNFSSFLKFKSKYRNYSKSIYIAYNQRFNPIINYLKKYLKNNDPIFVEIICSSNLKMWRKIKNSFSYYSAFKSMGGGVIYDLSHEIDYAHYLFGKVNKRSDIKIFKEKISNLTKNSDDYALFYFKTKFPIKIQLSYFTNKDERLIKIEFKYFTIKCDLLNEKIFKYKNDKLTSKISFFDTSNKMYTNQLNFFFNGIKKKSYVNNINDTEYLIKNFF